MLNSHDAFLRLFYVNMKAKKCMHTSSIKADFETAMSQQTILRYVVTGLEDKKMQKQT